MTDRYVTLLGAEDVRAAGHAMTQAAETMRHAAEHIDEAHRQFLLRFDAQVDRLQAMLERVERLELQWEPMTIKVRT